MCGPILALLILVPAIEIFVFVQVGSRIGGFETLMLVVLSAVLGLSIAKNQGQAAMRRLHEGLPPQAEVLSGPLLLLAAVLLIIPGFATDAVGFLLLIPPLRKLLARRLARRMAGGGNVVFLQRGGVRVQPRPQRSTPPDVIDVEVVKRERGDHEPDEPR